MTELHDEPGGADGAEGADESRSEPERSDSLKTFGAVVQAFRKRAGLTQEEWAPLSGYGLSRPSPHAVAGGMVRVRRPRRAVNWFRSSYSGSQGDDCVEVAATPESAHVRDSKDVAVPALTVSSEAWSAFVGEVRGCPEGARGTARPAAADPQQIRSREGRERGAPAPCGALA